MASITGLSNSNYVSSLYNSSNIVSGLASGMDTESMIENLTKSYQTKITQLQQKSTKVEWKQEAYRSIISKMYSFSNKYTSYTSSTNILSQAFFNSARTSSVSGANASKVSASGRTDSEVVLNSVSQMATSARYTTSGNFDAGNGNTIEASEGIDLTGSTPVSALNGSMVLTYGTKTVSLNFSESDIIEPKDGETNAEALARVINEKLADETITLSSSNVAASERIKAEVNKDTGEISFVAANANDKGEDKAGNSIYISAAYGNISEKLGLPSLDTRKDKPAKFTMQDAKKTDGEVFKSSVSNIEKISGKTININLNGTVKQITMPTIEDLGGGKYKVGDSTKKLEKNELADAFTAALSDEVKKQFGNKITVSNEAATPDDGSAKALKLKFNVDEGNDLLINTDAGDALGIGKVASNYLSTGKTLEELGFDFSNLTPNKDGKYDFEINGKVIGSYDKDTKLSAVMNDINSKSDVKVTYSKTSRQFVFTSKDTGENTQVSFESPMAKAMFGKEPLNRNEAGGIKKAVGEDWPEGGIVGKTMAFEIGGKKVSYTFSGDNGSIQNLENAFNIMLKNEGLDKQGYKAAIDDYGALSITKDGKKVDYSVAEGDEVGKQIVSGLQKYNGYTAGQDAVFNVSVNGVERTMTRSSNSVEIDGLTINFKGRFERNDNDPVTFQNTIQSDKVVDGIKNMIAEYNVILSEVRTNYSTMPAKKSSGASYDPLTDEDMSSMSESAIKSYEEKAKQGLLFADSNLSTLYQNMVSIFNRSDADRTMMEKMGIGISYDTNGAATITLNEDKLRSALEDDFDGVADIFTRSKENGAGTDGIMQSIKAQMDRYGSTTGAVKGVLVQQAGTPLASLSLLDNGWQKEIDNYTSQIEKWADKLKKQVDRYTQQFARMETLINQMNSQSSTLASMMGSGS